MVGEEEKTILKYALKNAVAHKGKPAIGPVISGFLGAHPKLKHELKKFLPLIQKTVKKVDDWGLEKQKEELLRIDSHALDKRVEEKRLSPLPNIVVGKFKTRIPPGVEKYLHVGHAISFMRNHLYAKQYKGKTVLRLEDTNPLTAKKEFYQPIRDDLKWLGVNYSKEIIQSKRLTLYYDKLEELMKKGKAYVCTCTREKIKKNRWDKEDCDCRRNPVKKNFELWKKMLADTREGNAIVRFKGNMKDKDASLRDPTMFRIITRLHALTKKKYRVWPSYDFAAAFEDGFEKMSHVIRTNEFATSLQKKLIEEMGFKTPTYVEYGRFSITGAVVKGRDARKLVEDGVVTGWDDPRMATIVGMKRRGIVPETFAALCYEVGISKAKGKIDINFFYSLNRRVLNDKTLRKFLVPNPKKIIVKKAPKKTAVIPNHPTLKKMGSRKIKTEGVFYVDKKDLKIGKGEVIRLKDLYNIKKERGSWIYSGQELIRDSKKVQWVAPEAVEVTVIHCEPLLVEGELNMKSKLREEKCLAEPSVKKLKVGSIVQFERYGFCRKDGKNVFIYSHD